ncbi:MAG: hypothetical protein HOQ37_05635 [Cupriavidus sp.]|nr:hypothetical protein [Cupriavidus sp.]
MLVRYAMTYDWISFDLLARIVSEKLFVKFGEPFIVKNRPGRPINAHGGARQRQGRRINHRHRGRQPQHQQISLQDGEATKTCEAKQQSLANSARSGFMQATL